MTRLALLLVAGLVLTARPAAASAIVAVSYRDGVVCGSDRRATLPDGTFADGASKIRRVGGALVATSNVDRVWLTAGASWSFADAIAGLVPPVMRPESLPALGQASALAFSTHAPGYGAHHPGEAITRVTLVQPTWLASFAVEANASGEVIPTDAQVWPVAPEAPTVIMLMARNDVLEYVIDRGLVSPSSSWLYAHRPAARDVTLEQAEAFVEDVITTAARHANQAGIGGGLEIWTVTSSGPHHLKESR